MVLLQLGSQQPLAEDTPGSSQQLLKSDKNPLPLILLAESSRSMHRAGPAYLFIYPQRGSGSTTMEIGMCQGRRSFWGEEAAWDAEQGVGSIPVTQSWTIPLARFRLPPGTSLFLAWCRWNLCLGEHGTLHHSQVGFPAQPVLKCHLPLVLPAPSHYHPEPRPHIPDGCTATLSSFPRSFRAALLEFPELYLALPGCFCGVE